MVGKAILKADEIISLDLPAPSHPDYVRMVAMQKDISVALIGSGLKADENRFRKRQTDVLKNLYDKLQLDGKHSPVIDA